MIRTLHPRVLLIVASLLLASCGVASNDGPSRPVADFRIGCVTIVDSLVSFTNSSKNAARYRWDFGNGATSTEKSPTVIYSDTGNYRVTLVSENDAGVSDSISRTIHVFPHVPKASILDVPLVMQVNSLLSWAATIEMILRYNGVAIDQCAISLAQLGVDCCRQSTGCEYWHTFQDIDNALYKLGGLESVQQTGPMDLPTIKQEIAQGRPILIGYINGTGTYVFYEVIYGYDEYDNIYIRDSSYGDDVFLYTSLINRSGSPSGSYYWSNSLYCIRKP